MTNDYPTCSPTGIAGTYDCRPHPYSCSSNSVRYKFSNASKFANNLPKDNFKSQQGMEDYLKQSVLGSKYTNYYRAMSSYISNKHTLPLTIKTLKTLPITNLVFKKLKNGAIMKGPIVNQQEKKKLISLMEEYKNSYSNNDFKEIIEDIENDIELFSDISGEKTYKIFN